MTSKILELTQTEADTVFSNGDYSVSLPYKKDLTIKENDIIQLKNIFIDTETQSQNKINIEQEITATLEVGYYYVFSRTDGLGPFGTGGTLPDRDGEHYVLCEDPRETHPTDDFSACIQVNVSGDYNNPWEGGTITVKYTDEAGNPRSQGVNVPASPNRQQPGNKASCYIVGQTGSFTFSGGDSSDRIKGKFVVVDGDPNLRPILSQIELKIPKGTYTPTEITVEMNRQLQSATLGNETNKTYTNKSLQRISDLKPSNTAYLCKSDGSSVLIATDKSLLVGASIFEFAFIEDTNQFSINYIHTPYYDTSTPPAVEAIGYLTTSTSPLTVLSINKNCGLFISSYNSLFPNGNTAFFWESILGFESQDFTTQALQGTKITINTELVTPIKMSVAFEDGKNTTGGFMSLGTQVNLTGTDYFKGIDFATVTPNPFLSTSTDTFNILGTQQDVSNAIEFGYFLVGIEANFKSDYYSKNEKGNIMGIVSRYYELNSFTSGTTEDSLVYVHKGEPMTLSDFRVRVMNPSKQIAQNLGDNTAVFIELISQN